MEKKIESTEAVHDEIVPNIETQRKMDKETATYAGQDAIHVDEKTSKRLFWKVNGRVLVCMLGTYFCQSLDKGTLNFASVMGIKDDADLNHGERYPWLGTILYMGVLAGEWPTNYLLQKLPTAKYLSVNVFLWGAVVACSAASTRFVPLMVVRFLLGFFEACVQPAFIIMTGMWYTKEEQVMLTSFWYCMSGLQLMVGGIMAWGVSQYQGFIHSWQLLFLILGIVTCVWAVFIGFWLPDSPMSAKCFTEEEKHLMVERVRVNETGIQNRQYKRYQVIETLTDPVIWCYVFLQITSTLVIGGLGVFSGLIIKSFGFDYLQTQLLNIAQGALNIIVMIGSAFIVTKTKQTTLVMHALTILPIIGTAIMYSFPPSASNKVGLLFAFYCTIFYLAEGNLIFSLLSRNVGGQTKKSTTLTITFISWAAGNMAAPQIFRDADAPRYKNGFTAHFCLYVLFNIILVVMRILLTRRNIKKRAVPVGTSTSENIDLKTGEENITHSHAFEDLTDIENPDFRYAL
ncbi:hypothetical protein ACHAPC_007577 [Botrytis cinerea]